MYLKLVLLFSIFVSGSAFAESYKKLKYEIDYRKDLLANDLFFEEIETYDGKIIDLELTLKPESNNSEYLSIYSTDVDENGDAGASCVGEQAYPGDLNGFNESVTISFRKKDEYHHPTSILVGERKNYPYQIVRCLADGYTEQNGLITFISGRFIVSTAYIPTALQISLYPVSRYHKE